MCVLFKASNLVKFQKKILLFTKDFFKNWKPLLTHYRLDEPGVFIQTNNAPMARL